MKAMLVGGAVRDADLGLWLWSGCEGCGTGSAGAAAPRRSWSRGSEPACWR